MFVLLKDLPDKPPQQDLSGRLFVHSLDHVGLWPFEVTEHGFLFEEQGVCEVCYAAPVGDDYWMSDAMQGEACMLPADEVRWALDNRKI